MVNGRKRFSEYLADAERLFLELHSNDGDGGINVVGYAIVERLSRLIEAGVIAEDLVRLSYIVLLVLSFHLAVLISIQLISELHSSHLF